MAQTDILRVTVIGQDLFEPVKEAMVRAGFNSKINLIKNGMLGNLKTLTYEVEIPQRMIIEKRTGLMKELAKDSMRLMPLYVHGEWMRIFVMRPIRI